MRAIVLLLCLTAGYASAQAVPIPAPASAALLEFLVPAQSFDCSDVSCKRLRSCDEACHKLLVCGQSKRDGDGDGIPCESLCSRRC